MNVKDQLLTLDLSVEDFQLILDGLEHLPSKDFAGEMFGAILGGLINDDEAKEEYMRKKQDDSRKKEAQKQKMTEDITVLRAKLISLKRLMIENDLLNEAKKTLEKH